jgi:hypothetical protein
MQESWNLMDMRQRPMLAHAEDGSDLDEHVKSNLPAAPQRNNTQTSARRAWADRNTHDMVIVSDKTESKEMLLDLLARCVA